MSDKREYIMEAAAKLFAQKGYHSTTTQEIAEKVGIAKGTLYLQFKSKEDLLLSILEHYQTVMFEQVALLSMDSSLTPKERLIQQVYVQFRQFQQHRHFMKIRMTEQIPEHNEKFQLFKKQMHVRITQWQHESLLQVFGEDVRPYIWDIISIFNGIMREYMMIVVLEEEMNIHELSIFLVERMNAVVQDILITKPAPILQQSSISKDIPEKLESIEQAIRAEIESVSRYVCQHVQDETVRLEISGSLHALLDEIKHDHPRTFVMKAIVLYLEQYDELKQKLKRLSMLVATVKRQSI